MKINKNFFKIFKFLKPEIIRYKNPLIIGSIISIISVLISYVFPYTSIYLINTVIPSGDLKSFSLILFFLFLLYLANGCLIYWSQLQFYKIKELSGINIQKKIFSHFLKLSYSDFETIKDKDKYAFVINDINNIKLIFNPMTVNFIKDIIGTVLGLILMSKIDPILSLFIFIILTIILYLFLRNIKKLKSMEKNFSSIMGKLLQTLMYPILKLFYVKIYNLNNFFIKKTEIEQKKYFNSSTEIFKKKKLISTTQYLYNNIIYIIIFLYLGIKIMKYNFTIGEFIGYMFYFRLTSSSFFNIINFNINIQKTIVSIDRLNHLLIMKNEQNKGIKLDKPINSVTFKNLYFKYNNTKNCFIIKNINFNIAKGNILAITGKNGCGKTTLLKLIAGLYTNYKGNIFINEKELKTLNVISLRDKIGFISQHDFFINGSIKDNIILNRKEDKSFLNHILTISGLTNFVNSLDNNIETIINANDIFLSGGYRQRILLARALYKKTSLLLIDEGSNHFDCYMEKDFINILKELRQSKMIIIIITHKESIINIADKIIHLTG